MRLAVKLALGLAAVIGSAQAAEPTQPIVLKAAYLFDSKSGNLTNGGAVLVEGDKIKALGSQAAPANAKVIDLGDATLLPGFIDAHTHITNEGHNDYYKGFHAEMYRFAAEQSFFAAVYAKRTLDAGFTTVRNVGAGEFVDVGLRNAINAGLTPGPTDADGGPLGGLHRRSLRIRVRSRPIASRRSASWTVYAMAPMSAAQPCVTS